MRALLSNLMSLRREPSALLPSCARRVTARNSKQPSNKIAIVVKATEPIEYLDIETMGFEGGHSGR